MARNLTLSIPEDIGKLMDKFPEINWSQIARGAIQEYIIRRTKTSIPIAILDRLRAERGTEFAKGKSFGSNYVSKLSYLQLEALLNRIRDQAKALRREEAGSSTVSIEKIDLDPYRIAAVSQTLRALPSTTEEFRLGVLDALEEAIRFSKKSKLIEALSG